MKAEATLLSDHFFAPLDSVLNDPQVLLHRRPCKVITDELFLRAGVTRVLEDVKSGRDFVQQMQQLAGLLISGSDYFAQLESSRRQGLVESVSAALRRNFLSKLRLATDRLAGIPELEGWEVWAGDGHSIAHASHDPRQRHSDGSLQYTAVTHIYAMDLRTGWVSPMTLCIGHENEIKALKRQELEALQMEATAGTLWIYDRAAVDLSWWLWLRDQAGICFISRRKTNMRPMHCRPLDWDRQDSRNQGVLSDEMLGFNNIGEIRQVRYADPETGIVYEFLTTEFNLPPGVIALIHGMRWNLEKAFDGFENKLGEQKAWATTKTSKIIQSHSVAMAHNLILLLGQQLESDCGLRERKVEKKYERWLKLREQAAEAAGRTLNRFVLSVRRIAGHTLQFIRWLRNHLRMRSTFDSSRLDAPRYMEDYI